MQRRESVSCGCEVLIMSVVLLGGVALASAALGEKKKRRRNNKTHTQRQGKEQNTVFLFPFFALLCFFDLRITFFLFFFIESLGKRSVCRKRESCHERVACSTSKCEYIYTALCPLSGTHSFLRWGEMKHKTSRSA